MRKIILICILSIAYFIGYAQYPVNQSLGSDSTLVTSKGGLKGRLVVWNFTDTTQANTQRIKDYSGAIIFSNNALWYRDSMAKRWVQLIPTANPSGDTLFWRIGGNDFTSYSFLPALGTTSNDPLYFQTNGLKRLGIAEDGIQDSSINVVGLGIDTLTGLLSYARNSGGGGGGSGTVTSISQDYGILTTPNPITTTGSVKLDSATVYGKVRSIVSDSLLKVVKYSDTASMLSPYINATDTIGRWVNVRDSLIRYVTPTKLTDSLANYFRKGGNAWSDSALLGTTNNKALYFKTNNIPKMSIGNNNVVNIGMGNMNNPELHIQGDASSIYPAIIFKGAGGIHGGFYDYTYRMDYRFDEQQFWNSSGTTLFGGIDATGAYIGNDTRHTNVSFDILDTTRGSIPFPIMLQTQRDALSSPIEGISVYNKTTHAPNYYNGSAWVAYGSGSGGSPAGNFGNLQLNRFGSFATPASDSLDFNSGTLTVKGNAKLTALTSGASTDSVVTVASDGTLKKRNMASVGSVPTFQQVLTAGSTLTIDNTIDATGHSIYVNTRDFNLYPTLQNTMQVSNFGTYRYAGSLLTQTLGYAYIEATKSNYGSFSGQSSSVRIDTVKISLNPFQGNLYVDSLNSSSNTDDSVMVWRASTGKIGIVAKSTLGGGGGSASGNYGNVQLNRFGSFATPASDSLDFDNGLAIKGTLSASALPVSAGVYNVRIDGSGNLSKQDTVVDFTISNASHTLPDSLVVPVSTNALKIKNPKSGLYTTAATTDSSFTFNTDTSSSGLSGKYLRKTDTTGTYLKLIQGTNITLSGTYPNITIAASGGSAAAGGSNTQVQYNSGGALAGISGATSNGTTMTLTTPNIDNVNGNYATTVTAAGTTTLTSASKYQQNFTGSTTQTVVLPDGTSLLTGFGFYIMNNSTGALTVNKNGGTLLSTVAAGQTLSVTVTDISSSAGGWIYENSGNADTVNNATRDYVKKAADSIVQNNEIIYSTDFISIATTANPPFIGAAISTGTAAVNSTNSTANHPGIVRLTSSTTANGGYRFATDANNILLGGGESFTAIIAPVNFTTTTMRIGFQDATTSADAVDGAYFEFSTSGAVTLKTASNSTRTTSATIATLSLNTWYKLVLTVDNSSSVTGTIYDASGSILGTVTNTANIPTGAGRQTSAGVTCTESSTTATGMLDVDFMSMQFHPVR